MAAQVRNPKDAQMTGSNTSSRGPKRREIDGVIRRVDAVSRDMTVLAGGIQKLVDVPSDCPIVLNGETVKLRLLQPGDHVRVTYGYRNNIHVAERVEAGMDPHRKSEARRAQINGKDDHE